MKKQGIDIGTFDFKYNNIQSDVIFDTLTKWKLVFIKRGVGDVLEVPVEKGYRFTIDSSQKYREFIEYFEISGKKGEFSINDFCQFLNSRVPENYQLSDLKRKMIIQYNRIDKEQDGIYPVGIINWELQHIKNPELPKDKYHRSKDNLLKTKQLYPEVYETTKILI